VFEVEPLPVDHPLWDAPNTILTPHVAIQGDPLKVRRRHAQVIMDNVAHFIQGGAANLHNVVDKVGRF
jgi:phosphoglycerate dehydrogenase-like enzyme